MGEEQKRRFLREPLVRVSKLPTNSSSTTFAALIPVDTLRFPPFFYFPDYPPLRSRTAASSPHLASFQRLIRVVSIRTSFPEPGLSIPHAPPPWCLNNKPAIYNPRLQSNRHEALPTWLSLLFPRPPPLRRLRIVQQLRAFSRFCQTAFFFLYCSVCPGPVSLVIYVVLPRPAPPAWFLYDPRGLTLLTRLCDLQRQTTGPCIVYRTRRLARVGRPLRSTRTENTRQSRLATSRGKRGPLGEKVTECRTKPTKRKGGSR